MEILRDEEWRPIPSLKFYEASSHGRIRSLDRVVVYRDGVTYRKKGKVLRPRLGGVGGRYYNLNPSGRPGATVHQLVAEAFLGPKPLGMVVNHIDGNSRNNCPSNLEYVTQRQNTQYAVEIGLKRVGDASPKAKITEADIRRAFDLMQEGMTTKQAAESVGINPSTLYDVQRKATWKHLDLPPSPRLRRKKCPATAESRAS